MRESHAPDFVLTPEFARSAVRRAALRTGSPVIEDDLAQEALLRWLKAFRRTVTINNPSAFFSKIVRDTVRDHWRRKYATLRFCETIDENLHEKGFDPGDIVDRSRQLQRIYDAFRLLSAGDRELMELFYLEGFSLNELSAKLNKSRPALKMALLRARNKVIQAVTGDSALPGIPIEK